MFGIGIPEIIVIVVVIGIIGLVIVGFRLVKKMFTNGSGKI